MIGIKAPPEVADKLSEVSVIGKKLSKEELHITMFYFENKLDIKDIFKIVKVIHESIKNAQCVKIKCSEVSTFPKGPDGVPVIVPIQSEDLLSLRNKIANKFDDSKIKYSKRWPEYNPHLTLSYSSKGMENKKLDKNISWKANEIFFWTGEMINDIYVSLPLRTEKKATSFDLTYIMSDVFQKLAKI